VSRGNVGEIVAQIFLLFAYDSLKSEEEEVKLSSFLQQLSLSSSSFIPKDHELSTISLLQFVQLPKRAVVTSAMLEDLYPVKQQCVYHPMRRGLISSSLSRWKRMITPVCVKNRQKPKRDFSKLNMEAVFGFDSDLIRI
jgi:hypothetical protein